MSDITVTTQEGNSVEVTVAASTSVDVTAPSDSPITVSEKGPKGDTGATGPQGPAGQGVPTGGSQFQLLRKVSGDDYDTEWDYADRVTLEVRFDEAVSKGEPLYITGFNNGQNRITVAKADASDAAKMPSIGLAFDDYSQNDNGQATAIGSLDDVNTQVSPNDFQEGDVLYVKAGGGLTNVKPTGTNLIQNVGKVGRRQQNNGEIVVMAIGRSNDIPNIPNGQAWIGNASGVATPTTLATVATSGSYNDLSDQPTIPTDTNLGNSDQTLSGTRIIDCNGEDLEVDVNGGEFTLDDTIHNYITASSNALTLQGITYPASDGSAEQIIRTNGSGVLSFRSPRGGVYSYSGYGTDVTKTSSFYYQFPSATSTSSSTNMTSSFVGQAISNSTYGANGSMTLDGLSSTESATYSMTVKITTDGTVIIGTLVPASQQFVVANQVVTASASEQTFTLTQSSPTNCLDQAGKQWVLGLQVTLFTATTVDFRVEDLSISVT